MNCHFCKQEGIVSRANGKDFYFCRTCRIEIQDPNDIWKLEIDKHSCNSGSTVYGINKINWKFPIQNSIGCQHLSTIGVYFITGDKGKECVDCGELLK